jgi:hypothetical protein
MPGKFKSFIQEYSIVGNISWDGGDADALSDADDEELFDELRLKKKYDKSELFHVIDLYDDEYIHLEGKEMKLKDVFLEAENKPKKVKAKPKDSPKKQTKTEPKKEPKEPEAKGGNPFRSDPAWDKFFSSATKKKSDQKQKKPKIQKDPEFLKQVQKGLNKAEKDRRFGKPDLPPASSKIDPLDKDIPSLSSLAKQAMDEPEHDGDMFKDFPKFDQTQEPDFSEPIPQEPLEVGDDDIIPSPPPLPKNKQADPPPVSTDPDFLQQVQHGLAASTFGGRPKKTTQSGAGSDYLNTPFAAYGRMPNQGQTKPQKEPPKQTVLQKAAAAVGKTASTVKQKAGDIFKNSPNKAQPSAALADPHTGFQPNMKQVLSPSDSNSLLGQLSMQKYGKNIFNNVEPKWKAGEMVKIGSIVYKVIKRDGPAYIVGRVYNDGTLNTFKFFPGGGMPRIPPQPEWYAQFPDAKKPGQAKKEG